MHVVDVALLLVHVAARRSIIMAERLGGRDGAGTASAAEMEGQGEEVTPAGMSVKSKVHEYGGGAFAAHGKMLVFCNQSDQRVYKQVLQGTTLSCVVLYTALQYCTVLYCGVLFCVALCEVLLLEFDQVSCWSCWPQPLHYQSCNARRLPS